MIRKLTIAGLAATVLAAILFLLAGRGLGELRAYLFAGASKSLEDLESQLPQDVQDRKLSFELSRIQQELIDRQVSLNLSRKQIESLRDDVKKIETGGDRRKRLLAEAYPVLKTAVGQKLAKVRFANADFTLEDFQKHLDDLIAKQQGDDQLLTTKKESLARLEKHVKDAEEALAQMRRTLETTEQEVVALRHRREQAEIEAKTLDMVAAVSANREATAGIANTGLGRLREKVAHLEARIDARRDLAPAAERAERNDLGRAYDRLEALKNIAEQTAPGTKTAAATKGN